MIVQNRKTLREYDITVEDWQKLIAQKIHRNFKVLDATDHPKQKILIPKEIIEYQKSPERLKIVDESTQKIIK